MLCFFFGKRGYDTTSPIVDLVSRRSLFFLFCIRDRENGSRASFPSCGNFAGPMFSAGVANFQMGTRARLLRGEHVTACFDFPKRGTKERCRTAFVPPAPFPRFLPPIGPYVSDLPPFHYTIS